MIIKTENQDWEKNLRLDMNLPEFYGLVCKFERNTDTRIRNELFEQMKDYIVELVRRILKDNK